MRPSKEACKLATKLESDTSRKEWNALLKKTILKCNYQQAERDRETLVGLELMDEPFTL
jgi:hypothetical protein